VVGIPLTAFVTPEHRDEYATLVRFAACKRVEVLQDAAERLAGMTFNWHRPWLSLSKPPRPAQRGVTRYRRNSSAGLTRRTRAIAAGSMCDTATSVAVPT